MKGRPTSYGAMMHVVRNVQHPALKQYHRYFLVVLSMDASELGKGARPGMKKLAQALNVTEDCIRRWARHCEELRLIKLVHKGKGPNDANVWNFLLENSAYPDVEPRKKNPETVDRIPRNSSENTPKVTSPNFSPETYERKQVSTDFRGSAASDHPYLHPTPPQNTAPKVRRMPSWVSEVCYSKNQQPCKWRKEDREIMLDMIVENEEKTKAAWLGYFATATSKEIGDGIIYKGMAFVDSASTYLKAGEDLLVAQTEHAAQKKQNHEKWYATLPDYKAAFDAYLLEHPAKPDSDAWWEASKEVMKKIAFREQDKKLGEFHGVKTEAERAADKLKSKELKDVI